MRREIHFESYRQKLQRMTVVDPLATATAAAAGGGPTVATAVSQQPSTQAMAPSTVQHPSSVAGSNQVISRVTGLRNSWFLGSSSIIDCAIQIMKGFLGYSLDLRVCTFFKVTGGNPNSPLVLKTKEEILTSLHLIKDIRRLETYQRDFFLKVRRIRHCILAASFNEDFCRSRNL